MLTVETRSTLARDFLARCPRPATKGGTRTLPREPPPTSQFRPCTSRLRARPTLSRPTVGTSIKQSAVEGCWDVGCWTTTGPHATHPSPQNVQTMFLFRPWRHFLKGLDKERPMHA